MYDLQDRIQDFVRGAQIFTVRNSSCGKVIYFHSCLSVHGGEVYTSLLARHTPPGQAHTPLSRQTPWPGKHLPGQADIPLGRHPPQADTPPPARQTPPGQADTPRADCHCSGRYAASCWNAFLSGYKVTINHSSVQQ